MFSSISLQIRSMDPICLVAAKDKDNIWSCTSSVRDWGPVNYCVVAILFGSTCEELLECPTKNTQLLLSLWAGFRYPTPSEQCSNEKIGYPLPILRQTDMHTDTHTLLTCIFLNLEFWFPAFYSIRSFWSFWPILTWCVCY